MNDIHIISKSARAMCSLHSVSVIWVCSLACLIAGLLAAPAPVQAQVTTGNILGFVIDQSKAGVPEVQITVTNVDTGYNRTLTSEADGSYRALIADLRRAWVRPGARRRSAACGELEITPMRRAS